MRDRKRGTVRDLRRENRAAVLWSLYLGQPRSRQELSAATGLSAASVTNVIRELIDEGIVIETGLAESDGGRPRAMLGMNPEYGYVIGVDIGETRTRVELFDLTMTERAKAEYPLDRAAEHDVAVVVGQIVSGLDTVLADSGIGRDAVLGVGVGVPGIIERGPEVLVHGQTYGWDAVPLRRLLRAHTDLPLRFDNGAKTMGQAELWFGAGRGARNAVMVLIGSGVGASLISGGATYQGATSSAAEFGHVTVAVGGRKCRCGASGCLEAYAGAAAILERYGRPMAANDQELALAELIDAADTSPPRGRHPRRDRPVPRRRDRHPDQPLQPGADHPRRLGRPAARRPAAPGDPRVGQAALPAPPLRRHLNRPGPARSGSGRERGGHPPHGVIPERLTSSLRNPSGTPAAAMPYSCQSSGTTRNARLDRRGRRHRHPEDQLPFVFDRFRAGDRGSRGAPGWGLPVCARYAAPRWRRDRPQRVRQGQRGQGSTRR